MRIRASAVTCRLTYPKMGCSNPFRSWWANIVLFISLLFLFYVAHHYSFTPCSFPIFSAQLRLSILRNLIFLANPLFVRNLIHLLCCLMDRALMNSRASFRPSAYLEMTRAPRALTDLLSWTQAPPLSSPSTYVRKRAHCFDCSVATTYYASVSSYKHDDKYRRELQPSSL